MISFPRGSIKKHTNLEFHSSASYIPFENKLFLGYESGKKVLLTRIRTPFERLLPKLTIVFAEDDFSSCRIKYSLQPFLLLLLISITIIVNIYYLILSRKFENEFFSAIVAASLFYILTIIELKIVSIKVRKAII